jgi:hypothetical protein
MKKYLIALIPIIVCSVLAIIYANLEPKDYPDPRYPYHTAWMLEYLSSRWFLIGIVLSILSFIIILAEDVSTSIGKKLWKRRLKKMEKHNKTIQRMP